jgi:putative transposase
MEIMEKKGHIDINDKIFSIREQCKLLDLNRSTLYYLPTPTSEEDLKLMDLLDQQQTATPCYGVIKMTKAMNDLGIKVGKCHVRTLLRKMGLFAVYPGPKTSEGHPAHEIYPYLLKETKITRINQVWSADITYIRLAHGFVYLVAIIDWHSRYVLSYRLSNTLNTDFCLEALREAFKYGTPEIFNTDQGAQFTAQEFIEELKNKSISISMDGRGRCLDNVFVERLWRSVKYEDIYLHSYETIAEVREGLRKYFKFFNEIRYHQSLDYSTPAKIYYADQIDLAKEPA